MSNENLSENKSGQTEKAATATAAGAEETQKPAPEINPVEQLQTDLERFRDLALRTQADFENFRKRAARDKEDSIKSATANLIERLLPVLDNFELGLQAAKGAEGSEAIIVGFEMVARQLSDFITNSGIEVINAEGQPFDHNLHEAIGQEPSDTVPEGTVTRQLRKGYKFKDRLIRPANVVVSKGPAAQ